MPWIALEDLVGVYRWAIQNQINGVFNACAPQPLRFAHLVRILNKAPLNIPLSVPSVFLKIAVGEQAQMLIESQKIPASKLIETGFAFKICPLEQQLDRLFAF